MKRHTDHPSAYAIVGLQYFLMDQNLTLMGARHPKHARQIKEGMLAVLHVAVTTSAVTWQICLQTEAFDGAVV